MCSLRVCALCLGYAHFARNSARRLYRGNAETMDRKTQARVPLENQKISAGKGTVGG